jgi:hypothetical protein
MGERLSGCEDESARTAGGFIKGNLYEGRFLIKIS